MTHRPRFPVVALVIVSLSFISPSTARTNGERGTVPDPAGYDAQHPVMDTLARAGVIGGIPANSYVKATLEPGDDLQGAIDRGGSGVVLLRSGTYPIWSPLLIKRGVILRGEHRNKVVLSVRMTSTQKRFAIQFPSDSRYAGVEDLTVRYEATPELPIDRSGLDNGSWYAAAFENNPHGLTDLYVGLVKLSGSNNWVDSVDLRNSGTDPVLVDGRHNTLRNCYIDRCYNKGGNGNGYVDIRGDNNLITKNKTKRLRHFAVQQGAKYNVITDNLIEGDVNFHNGDDGRNLLEYNEVYKPSWHGWRCFGTGAAEFGHRPPGSNNIIFRNTTRDYALNVSPASDWNTTYTFWSFGEPSATSWPLPDSGSYHSTKRIPSPWCAGDIGGSGPSGFVSEQNSLWTIEADGADVWGRSDDFYYVWQPLYGGGEIVAEVRSQSDTNEWAKAGLMVREFPDHASKHAAVFVTPGNGAAFQYRTQSGGTTASVTSGGGETAPARLRLTRHGDTISGYIDHQNQWLPVGSTDIAMGEQAYIGFFVSSHHASTKADVQFYQPKVSPVLELDKTTFTSGESVSVKFGQSPDNAKDWIGIYAEGELPGPQTRCAWRYVDNTQAAGVSVRAGTVALDAGPRWPLPPGNYFVAMFENDGYTQRGERVPFTVHFDSNAGEPPMAPPLAKRLIDATRNNGSFERLGSRLTSDKATHWDNDPVGDVDSWTLWGAAAAGPATASDDSGTTMSSTASHGSRVGLLQPGNAVYNLTNHVATEGDTFTYSWKWRRSGHGALKGQLAYKVGSSILPVAGSELGGESLRTFWRTWTVPDGHPAIGRQIALTLETTENYPEVDEVILYVTTPDSDGDAMEDNWEIAHFGTLEKDGAGDADADGSSDLTEFRLGLDPTNPAERFTITSDDNDPADGFTLTWPGKAGLSFSVERSSSLGGSSWSLIHTAPAAADGIQTFIDRSPLDGGKAYYRIRLND